MRSKIDSVEPIGFPDIKLPLARESGFLGLIALHRLDENIISRPASLASHVHIITAKYRETCFKCMSQPASNSKEMGANMPLTLITNRRTIVV